jgi:hypothetical protein
MFPWNSIPGPLALCANLYQTSYHVGWQDTLCYSKTTDTYRQMLKYNTIFITLISQIICISFFIVLSNTNHKIGTKTTKKKNKHTKHSHFFFSFFEKKIIHFIVAVFLVLYTGVLIYFAGKWYIVVWRSWFKRLVRLVSTLLMETH